MRCRLRDVFDCAIITYTFIIIEDIICCDNSSLVTLFCVIFYKILYIRFKNTTCFPHPYNQINTNGILTFNNKYPTFVNHPFPLELPSIAPFYSNVDTTNADENTTISFFESDDPALLDQLDFSIYNAFPEDTAFKGIGAFVATWSNVGANKGQGDRTNSFQAIICSSEDKTYVQFVYPEHAIEWIQAELGESVLADVRAQAGFTSEVGQYLTLPGSGKDNVKYLSELSNHGEKGSWWFLVGPLNADANIVQPHDDLGEDGEQEAVKQTCASHGLRCHLNAVCTDNELGFCCKCSDSFYGNGYQCLKRDQPVRVAGQLSGQLGAERLDSPLQSYVSVPDGRTYTAIRSLTNEAGFKLQLLQLLSGPIGWLFAKPTDSTQGVLENGFQLTGGKFNHTATIRFHGSERQVAISQQFFGMDAWDQLKVDIAIDGDLPDIPIESKVVFPDFVEELVYADDTTLRSIGTYGIRVDEEELKFSVIQQIDFERCPFTVDTKPLAERPTFFNQVFKITSAFTVKENALRIGESNKVTERRDSNACTDGTAVCGVTSVCVPLELDSYEVSRKTCKHA